MRLHYLAITPKNIKFLLLTQQQLTVFNPQKNPPFLHQTRKFVQSIEGVCFLKENNMNTKLQDKVKIVCNDQASCRIIALGRRRTLGHASISISHGLLPLVAVNEPEK
jgi:hypothetical protein